MLTHFSDSREVCSLNKALCKVIRLFGETKSHICIYGKTMHSMLDKTMCIPFVPFHWNLEYISNTSFPLKWWLWMLKIKKVRLNSGRTCIERLAWKFVLYELYNKIQLRITDDLIRPCKLFNLPKDVIINVKKKF